MKKHILFLALAALNLLANEVSATEEDKHALHLKHEKVSPLYVTIKPMLTPGGDLVEGDKQLSGDSAYGLGLDVGYYILPRLAFEFSGTLAKNNVTETDSLGDKRTADGSYTSAAVNVVYKQPIFEEFALFAKLGYEYENEKVDDLGIDGDSYGVDYAFGASYEFTHHLAALLEYESSTIDSLRGDAYFVGLEYRF